MGMGMDVTAQFGSTLGFLRLKFSAIASRAFRRFAAIASRARCSLRGLSAKILRLVAKLLRNTA